MKLAFIMFRRVCSIKRVKIRLRQHCHLPSCRNDTFTLGIMSLQEYSQCNRSKRKNECARGRAHGRKERAGEGEGRGKQLRVYGCVWKNGGAEKEKQTKKERRVGGTKRN